MSSFYRSAAEGPSIDAYGSVAAIRFNCEENIQKILSHDYCLLSVLDRRLSTSSLTLGHQFFWELMYTI